MGAVWVARNLTLDTTVALKLIRPDLDAEDAADRLLDEARTEARLEHRAIVRVFDFGQTEHGDPFLIMELLEGQSLGDVLRERGRLPAVLAVQTLLPVIDALAYAHESGVVHRDLKPENIFLAREGKRTQPKIVDFGIAKLVRDRLGPRLTRNGTVLGSPAYMAPEQARGLADVDHRADVWTTCVVLYETITGRIAFPGDNYNAVLRAVIEDEVVPATVGGVCDEALWEILRRGLSKNRAARWQSARALGAALADWLEQRGVGEDICGEPLESWLGDPGGAANDPFAEDPPCSEVPVLLERPLPVRRHRVASGRASGRSREAVRTLEPPPSPAVATVRAAPRTRRAGARIALVWLGGMFAVALGIVLVGQRWSEAATSPETTGLAAPERRADRPPPVRPETAADVSAGPAAPAAPSPEQEPPAPPAPAPTKPPVVVPRAAPRITPAAPRLVPKPHASPFSEYRLRTDPKPSTLELKDPY